MLAGMDPKVASYGIDPKMLREMDPEMLQSMGINNVWIGSYYVGNMGTEQKMLSNPNLMAMYNMEMPPMTSSSAMTNGMGSCGTPLLISKGNISANLLFVIYVVKQNNN